MTAEEVPPAVVTSTSTVPALPAGMVARMAESESTVKSVAATVPKVTAVAAVKFEPRRVVVPPPSVLPEVAVRAVTLGAEGAE